MELVNRYLYAVKRCLPKAQQADVVAELSDSIQSQVEEKEAELGRPLTLAEESAILKPYGRPLVAASRYKQHQQLIGPALFPFYMNALTIALKVAVAVNVVGAIIMVMVTGDPVAALARLWSSLWTSVFVVAGIVTIVVGLVERFSPAGFADSWDPQSLPKVADVQPVSRVTSGFELFFNGLFALWALGVPWVRHAIDDAILGPGLAVVATLPFTIGDWWQKLIFAGLVIALVTAALNIINLLNPEWSRLRAAVLCVTSAFAAAVAIVALQQHPYIVMNGGALHSARYVELLRGLNWTIFVSLITVVLISLIYVVLHLTALFRRRDVAVLDVQEAEAR